MIASVLPCESHCLSASLALLLVAGLLAWSGCTSTVPIQSEAPEEAITIDGDVDAWSGQLTGVDDGVSMAVLNDEDALYVSAVIRDTDRIQQVMRQGLVLWIDAEGGTDETFGIHYPLGMMHTQPTADAPLPDETAVDGLDGMRDQFEATLIELEIKQDEPRRYAVDNAPGIEVNAALDDGDVLTYEARISLDADEPAQYAVGAAPGSVIGLGLITPEPETEDDRPAPEGDQEPPPGGQPPPGGMGGQGGGGGAPAPPEAPSVEALDTIEVWAEVTLAE